MRRLIAAGLAVAVVASLSFVTSTAVRATVVDHWTQAGTSPPANGEIRQLAGIGSAVYAVGSFTTPSRIASSASGTGAWTGLAGGGLDGTGNTLAYSNALTRLAVGGTFANAGSPGVPAANIALWNPTGTPRWSAMSTGFNGGVLAVTEFQAKVIAAGSFTKAGGTGAALTRIASWNGTTWSNLGSGVGLADTGLGENNYSLVNDRVHAMVEYQGKLVVAGHFTTAGSVPVNNIAEWDGTAWKQLGGTTGSGTQFSSGVNNAVLALAASGSTLYATGEFTRAGGTQSVSHIAKWTGSAWLPIDGTTQGGGLDDWGNALAFDGTKLVVGGDFLAVGNDLTPSLPTSQIVPARRVAAFNTTNNTWVAMGDGFNAPVRTVAVPATPAGVYIGGAFDHTTGGPVRVARYTGAYGSAESSWSPPASGERILPTPPPARPGKLVRCAETVA